MVEDGEGGMTTTEFSVFYHFIMNFKKNKVTEVNLIHQGQNQRLNHHFLCQNQIKSITLRSPRAAVAIPTFGYSFHFSNRCSTNRCSVFFSWRLPFQLGRAGMKTKWSLQFRWNKMENQSNIPLDKQRKKKVMWHFWRIWLQYSVIL